MEYKVNNEEMSYLVKDVFDLETQWKDIDRFSELSTDDALAILSESGRIASEVMAPLNFSGDTEGCRLENGIVKVPSGFQEAFKLITEGGWLGFSGNPEFDGQGMPKSLGCLVEEMFWAANTSLYLYGTLTVGAAMCIEEHGTPEQKNLYLPRLYSGKWTGAMALTESHAGTDLGIMRTKALEQSDGTYSISGQKIFITSGEHELAENIVHLTLARLPDAPAGSKGISLFIVPKYLPRDDGSPGDRNNWFSSSLESKMGVKGSATSVINYDGATGFLLGSENGGLLSMFTMMNYERLSVGLQGLGAIDVAYQLSAAYAKERVQGRSPSGPKNPEEVADSLLVHPDVRRMLLTQRAYAEACRAFGVYVGHQLDRATHLKDQKSKRISELLTPVVKAFFTDKGFECAVMGQQVLGGHGYIKDWGLEQIVRDARIGQIYEGTNGVQANDLVSRKIVRDGGVTMREFIAEMRSADLSSDYEQNFSEQCDLLLDLTDHIVNKAKQDPEFPGSISVDYLDLVGHVVCAWCWALMASNATGDDFGRAKTITAQFFYERLLPRSLGLAENIRATSNVAMQMPAELF